MHETSQGVLASAIAWETRLGARHQKASLRECSFACAEHAPCSSLPSGVGLSVIKKGSLRECSFACRAVSRFFTHLQCRLERHQKRQLEMGWQDTVAGELLSRLVGVYS